MVNKVIILGTLGKNPDNKGKVTILSVATDEWSKDNGKGTEWHNVAVFGKAAEFVNNHCVKGDKVYVEGRLKTSKYEKNGETRYSTSINAFTVQKVWAPKGDAPSDNAKDAGVEVPF